MSTLANLRVPVRIATVPLQQYEELLAITDRLAAALHHISNIDPKSNSSAEEALMTAKSALESLSSATTTTDAAVDDNTTTTATSGAGGGGGGRGQIVPQNFNFEKQRSASAPVANLASSADSSQVVSLVVPSAAAAAAPVSAGERSASAQVIRQYRQQQHEQEQEQQKRISRHNSPGANNGPAAAATATAESDISSVSMDMTVGGGNAVGSGIGGTSATVRESIVEGGKLVKLVTDAGVSGWRQWALQNTSTLQFIVTFEFGQRSQVEALGDTAVITSRRNKKTLYRISLYPMETKPFVRGVFSGFRMSLRFGPPDAGYVAAVRTTSGAVQSVLERLEEIRCAEFGGFLPLSRALSTCLEAGSSFVDVEFPPAQDSVCRDFEHEQPALPAAQIRWERPERFLPLGEKSCLAAGFDAQALMWTLPAPTVAMPIPAAAAAAAAGGGGGGTTSASVVPLNASRYRTLIASSSPAAAAAILRTQWLVSAAAVLASNPITVRFILAALRRCTLNDSTAGLYRVELCHGGIWRNVVVDSLMPCVMPEGGQQPSGGAARDCLSARCAVDKRDVWCAVVEKAFAKSCGSYSAVMSSLSPQQHPATHDPLDAMLDLTGGVVERLDWRAREVGVFAALQAALLKDAHRSTAEFALIALLLSNDGSGSSACAAGSRSPSRSRSGSAQAQQQDQQQQQIGGGLAPPEFLSTRLGLLPGVPYRVVATATADSTRLVLIDDIYNIESVPQSTHVVMVSSAEGGDISSSGGNNPQSAFDASSGSGGGGGGGGGGGDPLPLRGVGIWADESRFEGNPAISAACRVALQQVLAAFARPRKQWSSAEMALLVQRFRWVDWRDAVYAFDGAGTLQVAPEMSLVPSFDQEQSRSGSVAQSASASSPRAASPPEFQPQVGGRRRATSVVHHHHHSSSPPSSVHLSNTSAAVADQSTTSTTNATANNNTSYSSVPRKLSHVTTLDLRFPNAFTAATPDWMLEITVRDSPVTLFLGLHQRDRRGLDPLHRDRHYAALLISAIGCSNSGVWETVGYSHNSTYWRGRDVQCELTLEPRSKPYYILPRRYASSSKTLPTMASGSAASYQQQRQLYNQQLQQAKGRSTKQQNGDDAIDAAPDDMRKDFAVSVQVPDGIKRLRPTDLLFRKPTADVMRAVRYSPLWRFDPNSCEEVRLGEYCASLQQQQHQKNRLKNGEEEDEEEDDDPADDGDVGADGGANQLSGGDVAPFDEPSDSRTHYFFRVVRQSRSVDTHDPHHLNTNSSTINSASGSMSRQHSPSPGGASRLSRLGTSCAGGAGGSGGGLSDQQALRKQALDQETVASFDPSTTETAVAIVNRVPVDTLRW